MLELLLVKKLKMVIMSIVVPNMEKIKKYLSDVKT